MSSSFTPFNSASGRLVVPCSTVPNRPPCAIRPSPVEAALSSTVIAPILQQVWQARRFAEPSFAGHHPSPERGPVGWRGQATSRDRRAGVRSGRTSEARPRLPVESGMRGSENPHIPMWGMGGAAAVLPIATAARRARAERTPPSHGAPPALLAFQSLVWLSFNP